MTLDLTRADRDLLCRCLACVRRVVTEWSLPFDVDQLNELQARIENESAEERYRRDYERRVGEPAPGKG